jgi:XTP/dITP diphosphohydrolase
MDHVVYASLNRLKYEEAQSATQEGDWYLVPLPRPFAGLDVLAEDGDTYEANATQKALFVRDATRFPALADDSGLEIAALGGWPGVDTRWAGDDTPAGTVQTILDRMRDITDRRATFVICMVYADPRANHVYSYTYRMPGTITTEPRGPVVNGFDAIFVPEGATMTLAEGYTPRPRYTATLHILGILRSQGA